MPKGYVWEVQSAGRKSKKEKAMKAMGGGDDSGSKSGNKVEKEKEGGNKERIIKAKVCLGKR